MDDTGEREKRVRMEVDTRGGGQRDGRIEGWYRGSSFWMEKGRYRVDTGGRGGWL
jgi:hypothetical protein